MHAFFELLEHTMINLLNSFSGPFSRKFSLPVTITGLAFHVVSVSGIFTLVIDTQKKKES